MRIPRSLSYSSLSLFERDREEFYLQKLAENAAPRFPQGQPAAAGSAFDAYVKSKISDDLFGGRPQFEFQTIFEAQVEVQNRDFALEAGRYIFDCYGKCGAYADLLKLLQESVVEPRMEFSVDGLVGDVPFTGKPDLRFILDRGEGQIDCIYDFKVKGFCSKYSTSPSKGYALCRDAFEGKASRSQNKEHPNYLAYNHRGLSINVSYMEVCNPTYADQLSLYGWLLGEQVGDDNIVLGIEEIVAKPSKDGTPPTLRVANHRARVSKDYQLKLVERVKAAWTQITTGHVFQDMTKEQNDDHCEVLEGTAKSMTQDDWFSAITRTSFYH